MRRGVMFAVIAVMAVGLLRLMGGARPVGGPFALVDGAGRTVTERSFAPRDLLIFFGYTHCRDVCPDTLTTMATALDRLGPARDRLQALFISLDPGRDGPAEVGRYAASFSPALVGLTGSAEAVRRVAAAFRVHVGEPAGGALDHTAALYLTGPDGRLIEAFPAEADPARLAGMLRRALQDGRARG